ncbi:MAG: sugar phosphate isomerase/epimerase family protein, partial [Hyphomicrobiales bacterium]
MILRDFSNDHSMLALNTATLGHNVDGQGAGWATERVIEGCAQRGIGGITFWRREIGDQAHVVGNRVRDAGMQVSGLCRTPFLTGPLAPPSTQAIMDDFEASIDMAHTLGTDVLTIVTGGVVEGSHSITESLKRVQEIVAEAAPIAAQAQVTLALEPLNPVYGGNRSCLVTVRDALDMCEAISAPNVKIAIDVYHVWWDTSLGDELRRRGKGQVAGYHLCDWLADTTDVLLGRGMMGDGVADLKSIRSHVEGTGYDGFCEVEIFSAANWWQQDPAIVLDTIVDRF